jgi:hypothetical protein
MKTSKRFKVSHWLCLTLVVGLVFPLIYVASAHKDEDTDSDKDTTNNASCSAIARHSHTYAGHGYYNNWQWAGFSASLGTKGNDIGHTVDGSYSIAAYVTGGAPGSGSESNTFTLRVGGIKIFGKTIVKWGDSRMANKSDFGVSYGPATDGYANANSSCGSAKTKNCST